jgi:hypothetical protein
MTVLPNMIPSQNAAIVKLKRRYDLVEVRIAR